MPVNPADWCDCLCVSWSCAGVPHSTGRHECLPLPARLGAGSLGSWGWGSGMEQYQDGPVLPSRCQL